MTTHAGTFAPERRTSRSTCIATPFRNALLSLAAARGISPRNGPMIAWLKNPGGDYFVAAGSGLTDRLRFRLTQESGKSAGPIFPQSRFMEELPNHGYTSV